MPFEIGNIFGSKSRRATPVERSQVKPAGSLVGARLTLGRANKAYDMKLAERTEARSKLAEWDRIIGEKIADDLDATADIRERQSAQSLVRQLELAVATLERRKDDAAAAVKDAEQAATADAVTAARAPILSLAAGWETWFVTGNQLATQTVLAADRLRLAELAAGVEKPGSALIALRGQVQQSVGIALHPISGTGAVPYRLRLHATFTDCVKSICNVDNHD